MKDPIPPKRSRRLRRILTGADRHLAGSRNEMCIAHSPEGEFLFVRIGGPLGVTLTPEEAAQCKGNIVTHNHPSGAGFSVTDVRLAARTGMAEFRVVGREWIYSLRPPEAGWGEPDEYRRAYKEEWEALAEWVRVNEVLKRSEDPATLMGERAHRVMLALARRLGIRYQRTRWKMI